MRRAPPELVALLDEHLAPAVVDGARAAPEPWAAPETSVAPETWERVLVGVARELLGRPGKRLRARLVELSFELAGGDPGELSPLIPQLVEVVHAGSLIIDDIQDGARQRRGGPALHHVCGVPLAINAGNWLYFAAYELIDRAGLPDDTAREIHRRLTRTMSRSHQGQALDLALDVTALRPREIAGLAEAAATLKTGELTSFAAALGALAARAPAPALAALARFGGALGVALQHLDDLGGLRLEARRDKGREDLAARRVTWPWAYLAGALDEARFAALQRRLRDARADELDALAAELAAALGDGAHRRARARLDGARAALAERFAGHPALAGVDAVILRLERGRA